MAVLNKNNIIEILFIAIALVFFCTMISLVVLEKFGYINTAANECQKTCLVENKTMNFNGDVCRCCDPITKREDYGTKIETNCFEVIINGS